MVAERLTIDDFTRPGDFRVITSRVPEITNKFNKIFKSESIWESYIKDTIGDEILSDWKNSYKVCCMSNIDEFSFECIGDCIFETLFDKVKLLKCIRLDIIKLSGRKSRVYSCKIRKYFVEKLHKY